jgi:hypothetical protein
MSPAAFTTHLLPLLHLNAHQYLDPNLPSYHHQHITNLWFTAPNAINEPKPKKRRPLLNILILIPRRLERHVYDPVAPVVHETEDRTRHQLHSLLYMGWRRIYFFDEIYGWLCVRIYLFYVLMMVDDLIWFDLRLTWLLHWWTRVQSPLSLTIFPFHYIPFETFLPSSCCKQKGRGWESTSTCYVHVDVFIIGPGAIWFWNLSYLLFLFCLTA